ncbi:copper amine oxidase N-terminal domain-containing protein [Paenibacillus taichungensis]|uniref:copper amine oxidase N-terminal domain-containing protein n=1 Tax=Paenibacillus taichungensis TaxID=484184 RepID=UPI002870C1AD|nr:copper amine oxidase N-terminal domain-containing protein [Paenibacillus taichungensis]MDR9747240.1 copper amine oxidase N-terminal domain-containing protein [Paenibacillus taichungensis]
MGLVEFTQCNSNATQKFRVKWIKRTIALWIGLLAIGLITSQSHVTAASGSNGSISSVLDRNDYLLDNGTIWSKGTTSGVWTQSRNLMGISKSDTHSVFGWTANGQVYRWDKDNAYKPDVYQYNGIVKVYGHGLVLLQDGTLHTKGEQIKGLESIIDVGPYEGYVYSALSSSGDVYYADYGKKVRKAGYVPDGKAIALNSAYAAVLKNDGSVVIVSVMYEDEQVTIASDVQSMIWWGSTHKLLTVKNDGTVWSYDRTSKYKSEHLPGLTNVNRLVHSYDLDELYAQLQDGSWVVYDSGKITPLVAPSLNKVTLAASSKEAVIGDEITLTVQESYSNGFKIKRIPLPEEIIIEQPQVAQIQGEGKLKVSGMGTTQVTLKIGDLISSLQLNVESQQKLTGATLLDGIVYLPVQSVFKTLGAKVDVKGSSFEIQFGNEKITLQKGSAIAHFNNKEIKMKGKVQTIGGQTVFPAHLLSQTADIQVQWDAEFKQAKVLVGKSSIVVESKDTLALIKKKELGSLSRLIGKSYWINDYTDLGRRFSKVTITDIKIEKSDSGDKSYSVEFRNAKGKTIVAYAGGTASKVTGMLSDPNQFFAYDPYQKYKWSQSTWNKIIAGEVDLGMTTTQARLAWGDPTSITQEMSSKGKIEVWVYSSSAGIRALGFVGGKLIVIY